MFLAPPVRPAKCPSDSFRVIQASQVLPWAGSRISRKFTETWTARGLEAAGTAGIPGSPDWSAGGTNRCPSCWGSARLAGQWGGGVMRMMIVTMMIKTMKLLILMMI